MFDRARLLDDLTRDEGYRSLVYDDANPAAVISHGYTVKGHLTIGIGWAVDVTPISEDRAKIILGWFVDDKTSELYTALPWIDTLSEVRQRALANMSYQLGVHGLQTFGTFLGLLKAGKYDEAADDLRTTAWHNQSGARALRIEAMIRTG